MLGIVVGATTGGLALGKKSTIDAHCTGFACDAEGKRAADRAQTLAAISTVGFGVGLIGIGLGVVLLATNPSPKSSAALRPFAEGRTEGAVTGIEGAW